MKAILTAFLLSTATFLGADFTNGVFYVDKPIESVTMTMAGVATTNVLESGKTYPVSDDLLDLSSTNDTSIYFSGGPLIQLGNKSKFTILSFGQEIENLSANPSAAEFGTHTINLQLEFGEFSIIYPNTNEYSRVNITTHYAQYELTGGKYYFRLTEKSALVYVIQGGMLVHGDKKQVDIVDSGKLAIAVPFGGDAENGIDEKIVSSFRQPDQEKTLIWTTPVTIAEGKWDNAAFFVIDGNIVGIKLK
jgi:hypothetical protein